VSKIRVLGLLGIAEALLAAAMAWLFTSMSGVCPAGGPWLVFALPIAFGLHVCEEFAFPGGYPEWAVRFHPERARAMTTSHFYRVNIIGGLAALGASLGAFDYSGGYSYIGVRVWLVMLATLVVNAVGHVSGAVASKRYCPGVVTSVVLFLPLAVAGTRVLVGSGVVGVLSAAAFVAVGVPAYLYLIGRLRRVASENQHAETPV